MSLSVLNPFSYLAKKPIVNRYSKKHPLWCAISLVSLALISPQSLAQESILNSQQQLSLSQAIKRTLAGHPQLRSFQFTQRVADGELLQASTKTPLMINAQVEDVLGTGSYSALAAMQTSLSISWLLEQDIIDSRIGLAKGNASLSQFKRQLTALDVAADTASHFITLLSQQEQLILAKLAQRTASSMLMQITRRVKVGQLKVIDELRAQANLSKKALVVEDLTHEIEASKAQLAAQWQGDRDFDVIGNLQQLPNVQSLETLIVKLKNNPRYLHFAAQRQIMQSEIALAKSTSQPVWQISAGFKRNEAVDDIGFNAGISIPFGGKDRNRGAIIALNAKQQQNQADADAWFKQVSKELLLLSHKIRHNRHVIETLSSTTLPALEQADEQAEKAYTLGGLRYSEWNIVQQELVSAQGELIKAYTNIALLNIELERLSGASLSMNQL